MREVKKVRSAIEKPYELSKVKLHWVLWKLLRSYTFMHAEARYDLKPYRFTFENSFLSLNFP